MNQVANDTLIVFARRPVAGKVKRRIARVVGGRRAAALYARLLARTLAVAAPAGYSRLLLMPSQAGDCAWFRSRYGRAGWQVKAQVRGDLGRRMAQALESELARGRCAVLIGSDLADVCTGDLRAARRALAGTADAVLGPAQDGGYWLIGLGRVVPELFAGMRWSTPSVGAITVQRLTVAGCRLAVLATRHDIDSARDLRTAALTGRACARVRVRRSSARSAAPYAHRDP